MLKVPLITKGVPLPDKVIVRVFAFSEVLAPTVKIFDAVIFPAKVFVQEPVVVKLK